MREVEARRGEESQGNDADGDVLTAVGKPVAVGKPFAFGDGEPLGEEHFGPAPAEALDEMEDTVAHCVAMR